MKNFALAALAVALAPQVASAQNVPAAVVVIVDGNKAGTECTACRTAMTQLQQQGQAIQTLRQQLATPLQTEGQQLQTAIDALKGKQPDAALQARITAFQTKQNQAEQQVATRAQTFERNKAYVLQQIRAKISPAIDAVQARRRANVVLDAGAVASFSPSLDVTNDVIAELNRTLTSIATTAPAQAAQPQGR
ncbi:MAG TPA: OmpH family outer membrane protein [Sphingomicrobium sp.]|jgi:Outer membrane protein|nr:OmpH family outer membrane protein [Sphingomicrobium sp.]